MTKRGNSRIRTPLITVLRLGLVLCLGTGIVACSSLGAKKNTGAIEHKYAKLDDGTVNFQKFFYPCAKNTEACDLNNGLLKEGDSVSIKLLTVFVCDFAEDNPFPSDVAFWVQDVVSGEAPSKPCMDAGMQRSKHYTKGEIVVLANAFELGGDKGIAYSEGNSDLDSARVVYYDDDVRESGQFLNMVNMPIYGPITYNGAPLYLRLVMMELDNEENSQFSSMLNSLANFGKQAYPPSSFALSILNGVGSTLLSGDQDDIEFRYDMVFDAPGGEADIYLPLKVGLYVFVRSEDRSTDISWPSNSQWDSDQARVKKSDGSGFQRTRTYFVISIAKNEKALAQDSYQTFSQLAETSDSSALDYTKLSTTASEIQEKFVNVALFDNARFRATELTKDGTLPVEKAQHREMLNKIICNSLTSETSEGDENKPPALTDAQLLRILAIAGPILGSEATATDPIDVNKATIGFWQTACSSNST